MYQKIAAILALVLCMPAYAAQTKNTMKMVSYFPVPYVAYDTVSANNAMDIGILNKCAMDIKKGTSNLGSSACSLYLYGDENAADLNSGLLNVTAGKLDLNSNVTNARIVSKKVQIGTDMTTFGGWLDIGIPTGKNDAYDALYISSLKNTGNSFRVTSKDTGAKVNSFHMFNEISNDFPGCNGTVTWKELELGADVDNNRTFTDIYLVCDGTAEVPPQPCQGPKGNTYTESCPAGQTGSIIYTWVGEPTCSYTKTNNCSNIVVGCSDYTYKITHKSECCPSRYSDPDCYTESVRYYWNEGSYIERNVNGDTVFGPNWVERACRASGIGVGGGNCHGPANGTCWNLASLKPSNVHLEYSDQGFNICKTRSCSASNLNEYCITVGGNSYQTVHCDYNMMNSSFKFEGWLDRIQCVKDTTKVPNGW